MPSHTPISVFMICCNEQRHIGEALASVQDFDEIVVVDSGSNDNTVEIARSAGAQVQHQDWLGFARQKEYAMSLCKNDWVLNLDADEVLSPDLIREIQRLVDSGQADALRLRFEDWFWGAPMAAKSHKRSIVRVYRKEAIRFPQNRLVHENVQLQPGFTETTVSGLVKHYGYASTAVLMEKQNKYSSLSAQEKQQKGKRPSLLKLAVVFPLMFVKAYVFRGMWRSGRRGLVHAHIEAMYGFLKEAKLFELYFVPESVNSEDQPPS